MMNVPNAITIGRFLLVPVVVWAIASLQMQFAFWLFVAAAISDMLDGFLAKRFQMTSEFGAYLDPLADKAMLMSIYVSFAIAGAPGPARPALINRKGQPVQDWPPRSGPHGPRVFPTLTNAPTSPPAS